MVPDRGEPSSVEHRQQQQVNPEQDEDEHNQSAMSTTPANEPTANFLAFRSDQRQFTIRAVLLGLVVGVMISFSNTYFGLQTGWISGMNMPSALIGFAYFKGLRTLSSRLGTPLKSLGLGDGFSEVENVLVQTVAGSVGTMPLGCGFVGVIPALEFLLKPSEIPDTASPDTEMLAAIAAGRRSGGLVLPLGKLILWALGICFFGVVFAVPLRKEVIIREKLKFPSGTATALMIGVLHGSDKEEKLPKKNDDDQESGALLPTEQSSGTERHRAEQIAQQDWTKQIKLLVQSFGVSGTYTIVSYFIPQLHNIPLLGTYLAKTWLWTLNPSPAYVGQGIIMGPATTIHMLIGAIIGWAILSPLAKDQGWAPGDVNDWEKGSKGWIVWVSLAIMLADAIVSLAWLILRPTISVIRQHAPDLVQAAREKGLHRYLSHLATPGLRGYSPVNLDEHPVGDSNAGQDIASEQTSADAPPEHQIGAKTTLFGLVLSLVFCIFAVQYSFPGIISVPLTIFALILAMLLSVMGVRALGETDLNPVSGISKLTQLLFALVTPPGSRNAVVINLLAGAISESGALQAGDLLQDLKTGHLLGASPKAQFWGQMIGSTLGAVVSAAVYKLYTHVYEIPSDMFNVPTGYVWIFTARLVTGSGLPPRIPEFASGAAAIWAVLTALRIYGNAKAAPWVPYVPGGIAVAVGMYNTPSFTLARTVGGLITWWWTRWKGKPETTVIVLASGLILGEGLFSIVRLGLKSLQVPQL